MEVIGSQVICWLLNIVALFEYFAFLRCINLAPGSIYFLGLVRIEADKGLLHIVGCKFWFLKILY